MGHKLLHGFNGFYFSLGKNGSRNHLFSTQKVTEKRYRTGAILSSMRVMILDSDSVQQLVRIRMDTGKRRIVGNLDGR